MGNILFLTKNSDGTFTKWGDTDSELSALEFIQYVLDSCNVPSAFIVHEQKENKSANLLDVAAKYGMRKRTFEERMKNTITYNLRKGA